MSEVRLFRLRAVYVKQGRLALLSHLEVARTLERTVRRSDLPFATTQGFSPHMRIAFCSALPVGVGSTCELFDVLLTDYVAPERALASLQQASVPDLMVQSCSYVEVHATAASVAYPFSTYEVRFAHAQQAAPAAPDVVTVMRKHKEKQLVVADFLVEPFTLADDGRSATFTLEAKPTGSLRPDVLLHACLPDDEVVSITRIAQRESL